jgi:hypothetical protein
VSGPTHPAGLPNFLVIGAMKAGTTSLFHYLNAHPQVYLSPLKEVDFFAEGGNWRRGVDWYRKQFEGAPSAAVAVGEASTIYTRYPEHRGVAERIASLLPEVRLIYVLRDPIERIRSHYQHRVMIGAERCPIEEAVRQDPSYVDCSRYALQLQQYLPLFDRERMLLLTSEDLRDDRLDTVARAFAFLGVRSDFVPDVLDREFYRTDERQRYPSYVWTVRRLVKQHFPASKRTKELVDAALPRTIGRLKTGTRPRPATSGIVNDELRSELEDLLRDDVRTLRTYVSDGDLSGWGIA